MIEKVQVSNVHLSSKLVSLVVTKLHVCYQAGYAG